MAVGDGPAAVAANLLDKSLVEHGQAPFSQGICSNLSQWVLNTCNQDYQQQDSSRLMSKFLSMAYDEKQQHQQAHEQQHYNYNQLSSGGLMPSTISSMATTLANNNINSSSSSSSLLDKIVYNQNDGGQSGENNLMPVTKAVRSLLVGPMESMEAKLDYYFSDIWLDSGDERTSKLPFMSAGPWKLIYATLIYLALIKWILPKMMRPIKAFELNWPIRVYNLSMVLCNIWAFYHGVKLLNFGAKCFGCEVINHRDYSPQAIELLHYGWLFFMSRLVEWLDTIFFVLRKKERQVTKLHVFHHSFVPLISWTYLKYHPGATVAFFPLVNTFVHSIMYTYYLLATFGPAIQPYLWWKRYLTSLQIAQFVLILIQLASIPLTGNEMCQYPRGFLYVAFAGAVLFLWLFYTYYIDTYSKKDTSAVKENGSKAERSSLVFQQHRENQQNRVTAVKSRHQHFARTSSENSIMNSLMKTREGSSKALSDLIDNSIVNEDCHADQMRCKKLI